MSGGVISDGDLRYRVQPVGEIESLDAFRNLVIDDRGLRLRGVLPILSGVRPDVAWTLVSLESGLGALCVESDLQSALARAQRTAR